MRNFLGWPVTFYKKGAKNIINLLDVIYPQVCGICGKIGTNGLCKKCELRLNQKAIFEIEQIAENEKYFKELMWIFKYEGEIRKEILSYKFGEKNYKYKAFVIFLKKNKKICDKLKSYDIIMPIPISKKRKKQRGYNQSALIARNLAKEFSMQYDEKVLKKIKDNIAQSSLNKEERIKNVQNVYYINKTNKIIEKKILLVDDIYTTGSTANECSKIVKKAGAKEVGIFTIAKD